ncbi:DUF5131 family protein [Collinsella aerofaciens]|uniref:DUF5131 family protein n=1 Tax=Collinsella aerofaciens TaxID=74426 RepID=UPI00189DE8A0|nr:DUF5131 family protein [Collinsella aerofaciens]MDB1858922.1 DUF5131 family protein [Collinsella aerofaciens]
MHDIWNPWHGCARVSEGCDNCYMYFMDGQRGLDPSIVTRNKAAFDYPLQRRRDGSYKVQAGELIRICMTSDFLVEEADAWRPEVWDIIRQRPDVKFFILTKRPERFAQCLPRDWGSGWPNVMLNVTCENQRRAKERVPLLLATPAAHRGVMCAPLIGSVSLENAAPGCLGRTGGIEQVIVGGENYGGARPCRYEWVRALHEGCVVADAAFAFIETGTYFEKDGKTYHLRSKNLQAEQAWKSGLQHRGRPIRWNLHDPLGLAIPEQELWVPPHEPWCATCGSQLICNGCVRCGLCGRC